MVCQKFPSSRLISFDEFPHQYIISENLYCSTVHKDANAPQLRLLTVHLRKMQDEGFSATSAAAIYDDCHTVWLGFDDILIEHCNRNANLVGHELARRVFLTKDTCIWVDESLLLFSEP